MRKEWGQRCLSDCVRVVRHIQRKIGNSEDVLPSQSSCSVNFLQQSVILLHTLQYRAGSQPAADLHKHAEQCDVAAHCRHVKWCPTSYVVSIDRGTVMDQRVSTFFMPVCRLHAKHTQCNANWNVKSFPSHVGPQGNADLRFCRPQPDIILYCETTDTWLVHRMLFAFTPQLSPVPSYTAWWERHTSVNNLPKVVSRQYGSRGSNQRLLSH